MKILKFHLFTHVVSVFKNFGLFKAVDTERTEAAHKAHKQAGQWTSRNARYFEQDVAFQFHHQQTVKAAKDIVIRNELSPSPKPIIDLNQVAPSLQNRWHYVSGQGCFLHDGTNDGPTPSTWGEDVLTQSVVAFLQQEVIHNLGVEQIDLYTGAKIVLQSEDKYTFKEKPFVATIRAHPLYKSHACRHGYSIYHWVYLKGKEEETILLCRCLAFCEINGIKYIVGQCIDDGTYLLRDGVLDMLLGVNIAHERIRLIPLSEVVKTAVVIPNNLDQAEPISKWILVRELGEWAKMFSDEMRQRTENS
jgi:hypothetical protein